MASSSAMQEWLLAEATNKGAAEAPPPTGAARQEKGEELVEEKEEEPARATAVPEDEGNAGRVLEDAELKRRKEEDDRRYKDGSSSHKSRLNGWVAFSVVFSAILWLSPRLAVVTGVSNIAEFESCNETPCLYYINSARQYQPSSTGGFFDRADANLIKVWNQLNQENVTAEPCYFDFASIQNGVGFVFPEPFDGSADCEAWVQDFSLQYGKNKSETQEIQRDCEDFAVQFHILNDMSSEISYWVLIVLFILDAVFHVWHDFSLILGHSDHKVMFIGMASFVCDAISVMCSMAWGMTVAETFVVPRDGNGVQCFYRVPTVSMVITLGSVFGLAAKFFLRFTTVLEEIYCGGHLHLIDHRVPFRTIESNLGDPEKNKCGFLDDVTGSLVVPARSGLLAGDRKTEQPRQAKGCFIDHTDLLSQIKEQESQARNEKSSKFKQLFVYYIWLTLILGLVTPLTQNHQVFGILSLASILGIASQFGNGVAVAVGDISRMVGALYSQAMEMCEDSPQLHPTCPYAVVRGVAVCTASVFVKTFGGVVWVRIGILLCRIAPFGFLGPDDISKHPGYATELVPCVQQPAFIALLTYVDYSSKSFLKKLELVEKAKQNLNESNNQKEEGEEGTCTIS